MPTMIPIWYRRPRSLDSKWEFYKALPKDAAVRDAAWLIALGYEVSLVVDANPVPSSQEVSSDAASSS